MHQPRADTAVRPYAEFFIGGFRDLTRRSSEGEAIVRAASPERRYRIGHPPMREGVAAYLYRIVINICISIRHPPAAGGHGGPPLRGICHRNGGRIDRVAVWSARQLIVRNPRNGDTESEIHTRNLGDSHEKGQAWKPAPTEVYR